MLRFLHFEKRTHYQRVIFAIVFLIFACYAISFIYPFLWLFNNSLKTVEEFVDTPFSLFSSWNFENFKAAFSLTIDTSFGTVNMLQMFFYSLLYTVPTTVGNVFIPACAAYVFAKYRFFGRSKFLGFVIIIMIFPTMGSISATYKFMDTTGMLNNWFGIYFLTIGGFGFNFLLIYSAFKTVSWFYAESAFMDGAGHFRVFIQIMLPQIKGVLAALLIMTFIGRWNDYLTPYLYMPDLPTLALGLNTIKIQYGDSMGEYTTVFASILIATIPVLIVYFAFSDKIMNSALSGGIKG